MVQNYHYNTRQYSSSGIILCILFTESNGVKRRCIMKQQTDKTAAAEITFQSCCEYYKSLCCVFASYKPLAQKSFPSSHFIASQCIKQPTNLCPFVLMQRPELTHILSEHSLIWRHCWIKHAERDLINRGGEQHHVSWSQCSVTTVTRHEIHFDSALDKHNFNMMQLRPLTFSRGSRKRRDSEQRKIRFYFSRSCWYCTRLKLLVEWRVNRWVTLLHSSYRGSCCAG